MPQPDLQAELGEPSHPCAIWPAEIDGLEMPFELMLPSVASVVRSHLVERLPTERPDTWARVEASDDGQDGGELGRRAPTSLGVALLLWTALASLLVTHHHFRSSLSAQVLQASGFGFDRDLSGSRWARRRRVACSSLQFERSGGMVREGFATS